MIWTVLSPTETLWHLNIGVCFILMEPRSLAYMRFYHCLVCVGGLPIPVVLYSAAYWMWLVLGNGEANFVFFQCLAYNIFVAFLLVEFGRASLVRDKALRWTERNGPEAVVDPWKEASNDTDTRAEEVRIESDKKNQ